MITRDQLIAASQGNPGAAVALGTMAQAGMHDTIETILSYGIRGTDIYILFSDLAGKNVDKVKAIVASVPKELLVEAAHRQDRSGSKLISLFFTDRETD